MDYLIAFLEGIITFISPCLLPMLPVYIFYFAGAETAAPKHKSRALKNSLGFVMGFTLVFVLLGAFAGTLGSFLNSHSIWVNLVLGAIVIIFGLNFLGILHLPFLNINKQLCFNTSLKGFWASVLFGMVFSIGWTPCVGAFLGSALMLAAQSGESLKGVLMLLAFSLGLGIPFIASAVLLERLNQAFTFIKRHYKTINLASGIFLILIGILMATGLLNRFLSLLIF
jgi:cytochrome c-type biogenesis protein